MSPINLVTPPTPEPLVLYLGMLKLELFDFTIIAVTERQARLALEEGWFQHRVQTSEATPWSAIEDKVIVEPIAAGVLYRNMVPFLQPTPVPPEDNDQQ